MVHLTLIAIALFAGFLLLLALLAFAAFRFTAKREGSPLGAAGGCALSAVLLGLGLMALIGFVILIGIFVVHRYKLSQDFERHNGPLKLEHFSVNEDAPKLDEPKPAVQDGTDDVRQY